MADPFDKYLSPTNTPPSNNEEEDIKKKDPFAKYLAPTPQAQDPFAAYIEPKAPANSVDTELQDRSFFDKPVLGAEYTKKEEIAQIANKHGVPGAELDSLAPYFIARMEGSGFFSPEEVKRSIGGLGSVALGIPQKLYKKTQSPEMEAALDDLQNLASGRSSYAQLVGEVAVPGMGLAGKAATTTGKVAIGAGTGAVA